MLFRITGSKGDDPCWMTSGSAAPTNCLSRCYSSAWYQPAQFVVRASWHGARPLVEAKPSDAELHPDWWTLCDDPILDRLEEQAMAATPEAQEPSGKYGCIGHR